MKKPYVVYATRFPGELPEFNRMLGLYGHSARLITDFVPHAPEYQYKHKDTGPNAWSQVHVFADALIHTPDLRSESFLVLSGVVGLCIKNLNNEPGSYMRCWRDYSNGVTPPRDMGDEETTEYILEQCRGLAPEQRSAMVKIALAALIIPPVDENSMTKGREGYTGSFEAFAIGRIEMAPDPACVVAGTPLAPIFFIRNYGRLLGEVCKLPMEFKEQHSLFTHREQAIALLMKAQEIRAFLNPESLPE